MKIASLFALATCVVSAVAAEHAHQHEHLHKRGKKAKTTTTKEVWDPWTTTTKAVVEAVKPTTTTTTTTCSKKWQWDWDPKKPVPTTTSGEWVDPAKGECSVSVVTLSGIPPFWGAVIPMTTLTKTAYSYVTVEPTEAASSTEWAVWTTGAAAPPAASPASPGTGAAPISPNGGKWAITYSPYTAAGTCKDQGSIAADIANIKSLGFTTVRIYSTDCSGLPFVGGACQDNGLKLILGIFIDAKGIAGAQPQVDAIVAWGQFGLVEMIIVGNEALFNGYCDVGSLAAFISSCKGAFAAGGYTGPVTTTEPLNIWQQEGASLCGCIDVVAANMHAYFNAATSCDQAGTFIASELAILDGICPGKKTYVVESGWPHAGDVNGAAVPGVAQQATALKAIHDTCGSQVVFFSFEDDLWKAPGAYAVEQSWGCSSVFA